MIYKLISKALLGDSESFCGFDLIVVLGLGLAIHTYLHTPHVDFIPFHFSLADTDIYLSNPA